MSETMDNSSVIEISGDTTVLEVDSSKDHDASAAPFPSKSSRRKQTRGGVKLDDTIDLDSTNDVTETPECDRRHVGDGRSDEESTTEAVPPAASNGTPSSAFKKSVVTSTPATGGKLARGDETGPANFTYEHSETAQVGDVQDEMYNSFAVEQEEQQMIQRDRGESSGTEGRNGDGTDELSDDEECDDSCHSYSMTLPSKKSRVLSPGRLPATCTLLTTESGGRVYLVGTAHFSLESQEDVAKVIRSVQPDIVLLELCKDRSNILHMDEQYLLEQANQLTLERMIATIKQDGAMQGILHLMMLSMSVHLTKELGMAPGGEFRRAYREASAIPGCLVHLGDRPIHVTLKRALGSLSTWQKLKLGLNVLFSKETVSKEDVERCKQKDILESMLEEMAGEFPSLSRVFVEERDIYLAHSLRLAVDGPWRVTPQDSDGPAVAPVVVGVVGIGHVQGIAKRWGTVKQEDVMRVVGLPTKSRAERWMGTAIKSAFLVAAVYGSYRVLRKPALRFSDLFLKR